MMRAIALYCLLLVGLAAAEQGTLSCTSYPVSAVYQRCTDAGTLTAGSNFTYAFTVDEAIVSDEKYDLNITLTSLTGDTDLFVVDPDLNVTSSTYNVGKDMLMVFRSELVAGDYEIVVLGALPNSTFNLTIDATPYIRGLVPDEIEAMGQLLMECCNTATLACPTLKATYPGIYLGDSSTGYPDGDYPNFCYVHGVTCSREQHLVQLTLPNYHMQCALDGGLLNRFPQLQRLDLSWNSITGSLATLATATSLKKLAMVQMDFNHLSGNLSAACSLGSRMKLQQLSLGSNAINGSIPACLTNSSALVELRLDNNKLSGSIGALAANSSLVYLTAGSQAGTGLTGGIPALNRAAKLVDLDLSGNSLKGPLPLLPAGLWNADLSMNELTGQIPASYGSLSSLLALDLAQNALTGTLTAGLASMAELQELDLSFNELSGNLPTDWSASEDLILLYLQGNALSGTLPVSMAVLPDLVVMNLSSNQLTGSLESYAIETQIARSDLNTPLRSLSLANNAFTGDLGQLDSLSYLGLFAADQEEPVLVQNIQGAVQRTLDLSQSSLSGAFPLWLVTALIEAPVPVSVNLTGLVLTCPSSPITLAVPPPAGRLAGLTCFMAGSSQDVVLSATPQRNVQDLVVVPQQMSAGSVFAIIVAVLAGLAALGGVAFLLYKRKAQESAAFQGRFHTLSESQQPALVAVHGTLNGGHKFSDWAQQVEMSGHSDSRSHGGIKSSASSVAEARR